MSEENKSFAGKVAAGSDELAGSNPWWLGNVGGVLVALCRETIAYNLRLLDAPAESPFLVQR